MIDSRTTHTVAWTLGDLATGASGSVRMVVQVDPQLAAGTTIAHDSYSIESNETPPAGGPAVSTIVASAPFLQGRYSRP